MANGDAMLSRVKKLLERAEHAGTDEYERQACLTKADEIMLEHVIDRAMLREAKDPSNTTIRSAEWDMPESAFAGSLYMMMCEVARHCRLRIANQYTKSTVVGHDHDISYAQMLWAVVYREFIANIEPRWDEKGRSFENNVKVLKDAGHSWPAIYQLARKGGWAPYNVRGNKVDSPPYDNGVFARAYKKACREVGEEPTHQPKRNKAFRASYAASFSSTIGHRLAEMRRQSEENITDRDKVLPALAQNTADVDEEFYKLFPSLHPDVQKRMHEEAKAKWAAMGNQQRSSSTSRMNARTDLDDDAGWAAGSSAASKVNLRPGEGDLANEREALE